jgi:hypothetical protein
MIPLLVWISGGGYETDLNSPLMYLTNAVRRIGAGLCFAPFVGRLDDWIWSPTSSGCILTATPCWRGKATSAEMSKTAFLTANMSV